MTDPDERIRGDPTPDTEAQMRGRRPDEVPSGQAHLRDEEAGSFLTHLPEESLAALRSRGVPVRLAAGHWLFRQGEAADSLYLLSSGRLDVVQEQPNPATILRTLGRGATLGELSLLTESPRSASVRARRDSELLRIGHADMSALMSSDRSFALALARGLGLQLQQGPSQREPRRHSPDEVIALVPAHPGLGVAAFRDELLRALGRRGVVATLEGGESGAGPPEGGRDDLVASYGERLHRCERDNDHVLLLTGGVASTDWDRFCLRQADRIVTLAQSDRPPPEGEALEALRSSDLVFLDPSPNRIGVLRWVERLEPRSWHLAGSVPDLARAVRRLTGRSVGIVLSGGGARGLAHIGVLDAMAGAGIELDRIGGCSMGAFVAALHAAGRSAGDIADICRRQFIERNPFNDYTVPRVSLIRARKAKEMLRQVFGDTRIEELTRPFFCVSADLLGGKVVCHDRGPVWEAVGASMSLPGLTPPVRRDGLLLVDGGVLNNLPVDLISTTEGPVVAVDVMVRELRGVGPAGPRGLGPARFRPGIRPAAAAPPLPSIVDTLSRTTVLGSWRLAEQNRLLADLVISPEVTGIAMFGFHQIDAAIAAGHAATLVALQESKVLG